MKEHVKNLDVGILFFGKVIGQNGLPVEGAEVRMHLTKFCPNPKEFFAEVTALRVITDTRGCFEFSALKGRSLYLVQIKKEGYEFSNDQNSCRDFQYSHGLHPFVSDKAKPVVFYMRKKGATTFLLEDKSLGIGFSANKPVAKRRYDCFHHAVLADLANPVFNGERFVCDLQVSATFNTNNSAWSVVLSPGTANGGIIATNQLLYEAPQDGYQSEWTFVPVNFKTPSTKYLYLRSREPSIYTRIEIVGVNASPKSFRLSGKSVTNPYGARNLEQATDLPYEVKKQLKDEAMSAFRQNKRPTEPDLSSLIKEATERAEKDKIKK